MKEDHSQVGLLEGLVQSMKTIQTQITKLQQTFDLEGEVYL
jgi:hypothetical protein